MPPGKLCEKSEIRMSADKQCVELLLLGGEYKSSRMIYGDDWRELVEEATAFYAHSSEGPGGGT